MSRLSQTPHPTGGELANEALREQRSEAFALPRDAARGGVRIRFHHLVPRVPSSDPAPADKRRRGSR